MSKQTVLDNLRSTQLALDAAQAALATATAQGEPASIGQARDALAAERATQESGRVYNAGVIAEAQGVIRSAESSIAVNSRLICATFSLAECASCWGTVSASGHPTRGGKEGAYSHGT